MEPLDYSLSFLQGKWPENRVRFQLESRTRFIDRERNLVEDYYVCASCKSESTFAKKDLFMADNYDFLPVFGPEWGIIFRRKAYLNSDYKSCMRSKDMWQGQDYRLKFAKNFTFLTDNADIRAATDAAVPIVAQSEIFNKALGLSAIIEFPVKTMNINDEKNLYQVDTGPVLLPDLSKRYEKTVDALSLAYVAFNRGDFADFVIEDVTCISKPGEPPAFVYHYSNIISLETNNSLFAL